MRCRGTEAALSCYAGPHFVRGPAGVAANAASGCGVPRLCLGAKSGTGDGVRDPRRRGLRLRR